MLILFPSKATRVTRRGKTGKNLTHHRGISGAPTNCRLRRVEHEESAASASRNRPSRRRRGQRTALDPVPLNSKKQYLSVGMLYASTSCVTRMVACGCVRKKRGFNVKSVKVILNFDENSKKREEKTLRHQYLNSQGKI